MTSEEAKELAEAIKKLAEAIDRWHYPVYVPIPTPYTPPHYQPYWPYMPVTCTTVTCQNPYALAQVGG
jgi:hypothetical protein